MGSLRPDVSVVVDHSNELSQLFSFSWWGQFQYSFHFFVTGLIPFLVIQYPRYSSSAWQKAHLDAFIFKPASDNCVKACSRCSRCSLKSVFDIMSKSSRYALANSNPTISSLIFS